MLIYKDYAVTKQDSPFCIALGNFDGMHLGHTKLIQMLTKKSKELNCTSMVYTFSEHPKKNFAVESNKLEMITDNKTKVYLLDKCGVDSIYFEDFSDIMNIDPDSFIRKILVGEFNIKCAIAGYDFHFGYNKLGNVELLKELGKKYGFEVCIVDPVKVNSNILSSSLIRNTIKEGNVELAKEYLGRHFSINGLVIHGRKMGGKIGFRTANISVNPEIVVPNHGVYLSSTIIDNKSYKSVTNIGVNPTFNGNKLSIETHIIGYEGYLYNSEIKIVFLKWQRKEKRFNSIKQLQEQIDYDIKSRLNITD